MARPVVSSRGCGRDVSWCCGLRGNAGGSADVSCSHGLRVFPLASDYLHVGSGSVRCIARDSGHAAWRPRTRQCRMCDHGKSVPQRCSDDGVRPSLSECGTVHGGFALQLSASQVDGDPLRRRTMGTVLGPDRAARGRALGLLSAAQLHKPVHATRAALDSPRGRTCHRASAGGRDGCRLPPTHGACDVGEKRFSPSLARNEYATLYTSYVLQKQQPEVRERLVLHGLRAVLGVHFLRGLFAVRDNRELPPAGGWLPRLSLGVPLVDCPGLLGSLL